MYPSKVILMSFTGMLLMLCAEVESILPTAEIGVRTKQGESFTMLASQASFGTQPSMFPEKNIPHLLVTPPADNTLLCQNVTSSSSPEDLADQPIILVPRGECTFETKALNAQRLGAAGVIVYGTLSSRYSLNKTKVAEQPDYRYTKDDIVYPLNFVDYDCSKGQAEISSSAIDQEPLPYNSAHNDPLLSGESGSNLCLANSADSLQKCPSKACLLTGNSTSEGKLQACCAWDLHVWLYADPSFGENDVQIPAFYVTMQQGKDLLKQLQSGQVHLVMYTRFRSRYNISSILIWALGVVVATIAAYASAGDYRFAVWEITKRMKAARNPGSTTSALVRDDDSRTEMIPLAPSALQPPTQSPPEDSLELETGHAIAFILMASTGLFVLFFFKIYNVVKVLYGFGCSRAIMEVVFTPLLKALFGALNINNKLCCRSGSEEIGDITTVDVLAFFCSFGLGFSWLYVAFTVRHPESCTFFWVMQDVMGACMCVMFLSLIKLNSMRVASILLLVAFFYDIFFVFITPLIFHGESVMITVATSGGPPKADPSWCEKYPDDANCQGGDPLPMLLTVPRIDDYQGGSSLLGLGDIVLPGLLLSFAARLDAAKQLLGVIGGGNGVTHSYTCPEHKCLRFCNGGYFIPLVVAYAIGLFMANAAVYIMNMGQPALLYLVPCCLGSMAFMAWTRNEFAGLWEGPRAVRTADSILYGEHQPTNGDPQPQPPVVQQQQQQQLENP